MILRGVKLLIQQSYFKKKIESWDSWETELCANAILTVFYTFLWEWQYLLTYWQKSLICIRLLFSGRATQVSSSPLLFSAFFHIIWSSRPLFRADFSPLAECASGQGMNRHSEEDVGGRDGLGHDNLRLGPHPRMDPELVVHQAFSTGFLPCAALCFSVYMQNYCLSVVAIQRR